jgi:hypothetical protein
MLLPRLVDVAVGEAARGSPSRYTFEVFSRTTGERWTVTTTYPDVLALKAAVVSALPRASEATTTTLGLLPPPKLFFNDSEEVVQLRVARLTEFWAAATRSPEVCAFVVPEPIRAMGRRGTRRQLRLGHPHGTCVATTSCCLQQTLLCAWSPVCPCCCQPWRWVPWKGTAQVPFCSLSVS